MRRTLILLALGGLLAGTAQALPSNVKTLARFDIGFARCEAMYPDMKGHADEAYLALWKIKADDKRRADLDKLRKTAKYRQARSQAQKEMDKKGPQPEAKVRTQCEATWAEALRNKPAAPAAPKK
ncbi:MAG: hypothetical protein KF891_19220 [Rhizobacter sp.]|nr:hypothetical protein [Rhizobacter sp.]